MNKWKIFLLVLLSQIAPLNARDTSVDCAGRPRWDRFVIDEKTTKWDSDAGKCFGGETMMYGNSAMYGGYEASKEDVEAAKAYISAQSQSAKTAKAAQSNTAKTRAAKLKQAKSGKAAKANKTAAAGKTRAAKLKQAKSGKAANAGRAAAFAGTAKAKAAARDKIGVMSANPRRAMDGRLANADESAAEFLSAEHQTGSERALPDSKAAAIASSLAAGFIDVESWCIRISPPVRGPMPRGFVLMPGRPDLMCCVTRNRKS
jgi:hypothetical protein